MDKDQIIEELRHLVIDMANARDKATVPIMAHRGLEQVRKMEETLAQESRR